MESIPTLPSPTSVLSPRVALPVELWTAVFNAYLYRPSDFSHFLQWEDVAGLQIALEDIVDEFKRSLYLVSRQFYATAYCVARRYLVFTEPRDISTAIRDISRGARYSSINVGSWTQRLDLHIGCTYAPSMLTGLCRLIPNLRVLVVRNFYPRRSSVIRYRPDSIIQALGRFCPRLQRLQFESFNEEPSVRLLKDILRLLPSLRTLHLDSAYSPAQGDDDNGDPITFAHTALSTLSMGSVHRQYRVDRGLDRVGVFLTACIPHHALPNLRNLHLHKGIPNMGQFLDAYGPQLQELAFASGDIAFAMGYASSVPEDHHPHVLSFCPNLRKLILVTTEWPAISPVRPLVSHPHVEEAVVIYLEPLDAPGGNGAVILALHEIDTAPFPALKLISVTSAVGLDAVEGRCQRFYVLRRMQSKGIQLETVDLCGERYF